MLQYDMAQILGALMQKKGSDMHISAGCPPKFRINGELISLNLPVLTPEDTKTLCLSVLSDDQKELLYKNYELDFAFTVEGVARFRGNVFFQRGSLAGAFRVIPIKVLTLEELNLPDIFKEISSLPRGLVLVTGATGSGKSTTLAAMVDYINSNFQSHIITIEDPVEFVHTSKKALINQREIGADSMSFDIALKSSLRQDPDVILVGELRTLETISCALTAAETGHLVLGTLHTNSAISSLTRILNVFPDHQRDQVKVQLSMTLEAVVSQVLVPAMHGGRVMAFELMRRTPAISALIADGKFKQIYSYMQSGQSGTGMQTLNQMLMDFVDRKVISREEALGCTNNLDEFKKLLGIED